jgi:hypothetical protein
VALDVKSDGRAEVGTVVLLTPEEVDAGAQAPLSPATGFPDRRLGHCEGPVQAESEPRTPPGLPRLPPWVQDGSDGTVTSLSVV